MSLDFFERLKQNVEASPDQPAFVALSENGRELITYGQVDQEVRKIGAFLVENGVKSGSRVGILMENHPRWGLAFLAGQSAGAAIVPLDVLHSAETLAYLIEHSECTFLFCSEEQLATLEQIELLLADPLPVVVIGNCENRYQEWSQILENQSEQHLSLPLVPQLRIRPKHYQEPDED